MLLAGFAGDVTFPNGVSAHIKEITLNRTQDLGDTSGFGDNGEKTRIALCRDLSGSASGIVDDALDPGVDDLGGRTPGTMTIYPEKAVNDFDADDGYTDWSFTFEALLSAVRIRVDYSNEVTITFDWAKSGGVVTDSKASPPPGP